MQTLTSKLRRLAVRLTTLHAHAGQPLQDTMTTRGRALLLALAALTSVASLLAAQPSGAVETTYASQGPFHRLATATGASASSTTSVNNWVDLPGAVVIVDLEPGHQDLLVARFTGESACSGAAG